MLMLDAISSLTAAVCDVSGIHQPTGLDSATEAAFKLVYVILFMLGGERE